MNAHEFKLRNEPETGRPHLGQHSPASTSQYRIRSDSKAAELRCRHDDGDAAKDLQFSSRLRTRTGDIGDHQTWPIFQDWREERDENHLTTMTNLRWRKNHLLIKWTTRNRTSYLKICIFCEHHEFFFIILSFSVVSYWLLTHATKKK